jgi:hypothetical protein
LPTIEKCFPVLQAISFEVEIEDGNTEGEIPFYHNRKNDQPIEKKKAKRSSHGVSVHKIKNSL